MKKYVIMCVALLVLGSCSIYTYRYFNDEIKTTRDIINTHEAQIEEKSDTEQASDDSHESETIVGQMKLTLTEQDAKSILKTNMSNYFDDKMEWEVNLASDINGWHFAGAAYTGGLRVSMYIWPISETQVNVIVEERSSLTGYLGTDTYIFDINNEVTEVNKYPYAVSKDELPDVLTFIFSESVNLPSTVSISGISSDKQRVTFTREFDGQVVGINEFLATIQLIETKKIRIFSAGSSEVREVFVNTEIALNEHVSEDGLETLHSLYLFVNREGTYSLATGNYAGNVPDDMRDVMIEVLQ